MASTFAATPLRWASFAFGEARLLAIRRLAEGERRIVDQNIASWNQIAGWLRQLETLSRRHEPWFRSRARAREPVEWPTLRVGDRQDEQVLLVLFERDQVGEPLYGGLADQRSYCLRARPCRAGFWGVANSNRTSSKPRR